jgi:hypothetical protein
MTVEERKRSSHAESVQQARMVADMQALREKQHEAFQRELAASRERARTRKHEEHLERRRKHQQEVALRRSVHKAEEAQVHAARVRRANAQKDYARFTALAAAYELASLRAAADERQRSERSRRRLLQERQLRERLREKHEPRRGPPAAHAAARGKDSNLSTAAASLRELGSAPPSQPAFLPAHLARISRDGAPRTRPLTAPLVRSYAPSAADDDGARATAPVRAMSASRSRPLLPSNTGRLGWPSYTGQPMVGTPAKFAASFW